MKFSSKIKGLSPANLPNSGNSNSIWRKKNLDEEGKVEHPFIVAAWVVWVPILNNTILFPIVSNAMWGSIDPATMDFPPKKKTRSTKNKYCVRHATIKN